MISSCMRRVSYEEARLSHGSPLLACCASVELLVVVADVAYSTPRRSATFVWVDLDGVVNDCCGLAWWLLERGREVE